MGRRRGFFATLAYEAEQAERARLREQRQQLAQARADHRALVEAQRAAELAEAENDAELFSCQMKLLLTVHHGVSPTVDWPAIANRPAPTARVPDASASEAARLALASYLPNFFERLLNITGRRRRLEADLADSLEALNDAYQRAEQEHQAAVEIWKEQSDLARAVLSGSADAFMRVVDESGCLGELEELGCKVNVSWLGAQIGVVEMRAKGSDVVPDEEKKLTARGKLTKKKMAQGKFWETYQDFICGAALRAGRELLAVLPLEGVLVDVFTALLNSTTGREEECVVLSVYCPRNTMSRINFKKADPSDVVKTLKHSMDFKRSKGMAAVTPINPRELVA